MRKWKDVVAGPIVGHQDPAGQALIEFRQSVGNRRVSHLHHECLNVSKQQPMQGLASFYRFPEFIGRDPLRFSCYLDVSVMRRGLGPE